MWLRTKERKSPARQDTPGPLLTCCNLGTLDAKPKPCPNVPTSRGWSMPAKQSRSKTGGKSCGGSRSRIVDLGLIVYAEKDFYAADPATSVLGPKQVLLSTNRKSR
ncbi:hypothetical protein CSUI_005596 [Cystoisospora suis]|uniref:Uncharacterized protein n=1 Tax=Cystoisospora suis TaxID=483139 RepID=A0A2C6KWI7_9APIC|nr:hypothetical protein CSUI_005596 [Cystoisospora suis]